MPGGESGFHYSRSNQFAQLVTDQPLQQNAESLHVNLTIAVEPKLPILKLGYVRLTEALDGEKRPMLPKEKENASGTWDEWSFHCGGGNRSYVQQTQARLVWPSKTSRTVKTIKGVIPVTLLADQKPAVVTDRICPPRARGSKQGPRPSTLRTSPS